MKAYKVLSHFSFTLIFVLLDLLEFITTFFLIFLIVIKMKSNYLFCVNAN